VRVMDFARSDEHQPIRETSGGHAATGADAPA
jgi:hypothetical protein